MTAEEIVTGLMKTQGTQVIDCQLVQKNKKENPRKNIYYKNNSLPAHLSISL